MTDLELRAWLVVLISILIALELTEAGTGSWEQQAALAAFVVVGIAVASVSLSLRVLPWWCTAVCLGCTALAVVAGGGPTEEPRPRVPGAGCSRPVETRETRKNGSREMALPLALAAVAIAALVCATVLTMAGHSWMGATMVVVALIGLLEAGGLETDPQKKVRGFQP